MHAYEQIVALVGHTRPVRRYMMVKRLQRPKKDDLAQRISNTEGSPSDATIWNGPMTSCAIDELRTRS